MLVSDVLPYTYMNISVSDYIRSENVQPSIVLELLRKSEGYSIILEIVASTDGLDYIVTRHNKRVDYIHAHADEIINRIEGKTEPYNTINGIIRYEDGELDQDETIELFTHLIASGIIWQLQGSYQRQAYALGLIS